MKEFRVVLIAFFSLVAARMMSEIPSCPNGLTPICGNGILVLIPYFVSTYFVDSLLSVAGGDEDKKIKIVNLAFCLPYIFFSMFVVREFFTTISVVTIEYILSVNTIYTAVVYALVYFINSQKIVKKANTVFMITLILSAIAFTFI